MDKHHLLMKIQLFSTHLDGLPLWHLVMSDNYVKAFQVSLTWRQTEFMTMNLNEVNHHIPVPQVSCAIAAKHFACSLTSLFKKRFNVTGHNSEWGTFLAFWIEENL